MSLAETPRVQVIRLDAAGRPWRLAREMDLHAALINVPLSREPGAPGIPYSFVAMPGRYVSALLAFAAAWYRRLPLLVLNPAWDLSPDVLQAIFAELGEQVASGVQAVDVQVFSDYSDRVLAYLFAPASRPLAAEAAALRDLSGFEPALDTQLLQALGLDARICRVRTPPGMDVLPAIYSFPSLAALAKHVARVRLCALRAGSMQTWACITHHAGDLLLALKVIEANPGCVQGVLTHSDYVDIVHDVLPEMPVKGIQGPMPGRGHAWSRAHPLFDELLYFERYVLPAIPPGVAICFLRPVRGYEVVDYSFAAQLAFALADVQAMAAFPGGSAQSGDGLLSSQTVTWPRVRGKRVLLHFDGGWPIKIYPKSAQEALVRRLRDAQWSVSVTGGLAVQVEDVVVHEFTKLSAFRALLEAHDVLVGMDSFPCHYASQHLGMPTICLFGPTSQTHLSHASPNYVALSKGMSCAPCHSYSHCPIYGGSDCRNFVDPDTVIAVLTRCLERAP